MYAHFDLRLCTSFRFQPRGFWRHPDHLSCLPDPPLEKGDWQTCQGSQADCVPLPRPHPWEKCQSVREPCTHSNMHTTLSVTKGAVTPCFLWSETGTIKSFLCCRFGFALFTFMPNTNYKCKVGYSCKWSRKNMITLSTEQIWARFDKNCKGRVHFLFVFWRSFSHKK